jgi:hypothetical protein
MLFYERIERSASFAAQKTEATIQPQDVKANIDEALQAEVAEAARVPLPKGTGKWDDAQISAEHLDPSQIPLPPGQGDSYLAELDEGQNTEATQIPLPTETDEEEVILLCADGEQRAAVSSFSATSSLQAPTNPRSSVRDESEHLSESICISTVTSTPSAAKRIKMRTSSGFAASGGKESPLQSAIRMGTAF